jgi:transposase, IS30 family
MQISHESIYRFIYHRAASGEPRWRALLPQAKYKRGRRKRGGGATMKNFTDYVSIDQRPEVVAARTTPGHFEADLMAFRQNSQFILVAHERLSRKAFVHRQPNKTARAVRSRLTKTLKKLPKIMRQTITYDNGPEFALHHKINASLGTQSYFCHTHSPWEKGGVENTIGRLRRHLPRHTDVKAMSHQAIAKLVKQHNQTPRKCLGYLTPNEAFDKQLKESTVALQTRIQPVPGVYPSNSCSSFFAISSIFSGGQPGISMPRRSPIDESTSLISFRLLRPKFGVRSISASVLPTRSPI